MCRRKKRRGRARKGWLTTTSARLGRGAEARELGVLRVVVDVAGRAACAQKRREEEGGRARGSVRREREERRRRRRTDRADAVGARRGADAVVRGRADETALQGEQSFVRTRREERSGGEGERRRTLPQLYGSNWNGGGTPPLPLPLLFPELPLPLPLPPLPLPFPPPELPLPLPFPELPLPLPLPELLLPLPLPELPLPLPLPRPLPCEWPKAELPWRLARLACSAASGSARTLTMRASRAS